MHIRYKRSKHDSTSDLPFPSFWNTPAISARGEKKEYFSWEFSDVQTSNKT